ncbi:MAG: hypothetical protein LAT75_07580 [Candidatus Cyclonatronum sp.]|uniref:hypothetical protein n=1 Tax=Cyclonatronum sp. TaxID=3024185 RepID=UPI0025BE07E0|nr:hypothetical protein [Cyclonatronum sp.]MCH8486711.1 hypothetical protein [Cyclonatronum sp.]
MIAASQLINPLSAQAQTTEQSQRILEIKQSGNYHWGEAFHENREQALSLARQDLIERIVVFVISDSEVRVSENEEELRSEVQMRSRTLSRMELRGAGHIEVQRRDGSWRTTAYISRADFARTLELEAGRLRSMLAQAEMAESLGNFNGAMLLWLEVLAATTFFPEPVFVTAFGSDAPVEARLLSRERILRRMNEADIRVSGVRNRSSGDSIEMYLDLEIRFGNQPAEMLEAGIDRRGAGAHPVVNGRTSLYIDQPRTSALEELVLRISPSPGSSLAEETTDALLRIRPETRRAVTADWRPALSLDIETVALSNGRVRLIPNTQNLSVFSVRWTIDGRSTTESTPVVTFQPGSDTAEVSLHLNNDEHLTTHKSLHRSGRISPLSERRPTPPATAGRSPRPETAPTPAPARSTASESAIVTALLDELLRIRIGDQFISRLNGLQQEGRLIVGNRTDMPDASLSYLAVINPVNRRVEAVLGPALNGARTRLPGTTTFTETEIPERFRNMGTVWFHFTE